MQGAGPVGPARRRSRSTNYNRSKVRRPFESPQVPQRESGAAGPPEQEESRASARQLSDFAHPQPQLLGVSKELIKYRRAPRAPRALRAPRRSARGAAVKHAGAAQAGAGRGGAVWDALHPLGVRPSARRAAPNRALGLPARVQKLRLRLAGTLARPKAAPASAPLEPLPALR